jgi:hypothetical protein
VTRWSTIPGEARHGRSVRAEHVRDDDLVGTAVGITADGALVGDAAGSDHTVVADVHHSLRFLAPLRVIRSSSGAKTFRGRGVGRRGR